MAAFAGKFKLNKTMYKLIYSPLIMPHIWAKLPCMRTYTSALDEATAEVAACAVVANY